MLLALVLLLLQTEWGSRVAKDLLLAQVNPIGEAHLQIDDLDGNWITHLEAKGVRLVRPAAKQGSTLGVRPLTPSDGAPAAPGPAPRTAPDSVRMVQIDSLNTDYRLLELLSNRVHLSGGQVYDPDVRMAQQTDGSWDLLQPFVSDTTVQDTTASAWTVRLDSVRLRGGRLDARFHTRNGTDSTLRVRDIDVRNLTGRFTPPGQTLERRLTFSGRLDKRRLVVSTLDLNSPYSNARGNGTLVLPGAEGGPVRDVDFRIEADPLSFRDLAGFVPGIDPSRSVRFTLNAEGTSERLQTTLDATFSDGATANASGTVAPGVGAGPLAYDLDGQVRRFDPDFFTPGPATGSVSAHFSADLRGASAEALEGTLAAEILADSRFGEYRLDRTTLDARFAGDGTVALDAQGGLRGASFAADGTLRPFADPLSYNLSGTVRNVDLGRFTDNPGQSSDLDGQIRLQGYGTSLADANVTAQLALGGSRVNRFSINEGRFTARLIDGTLTLDARVRSPRGAVDARGNVWLTEDPLRYRVTEGRIQNLDVAALAGDTTRSSFTGTFRLEGSGTTPRGDLRLDVAGLQLTDSYYGPYVINTTNLDARLAGGRLDLDGRAELDGGTFNLSGATLYPFQATPSFSVESASFANVNIGQLGQYPGGDAAQSSALSGSVSLEGQGFAPQTMYLTGTARLTGSRLNRQQINSAVVEFTLQDGRLAYDGSLDVPQGQTTIAGTVRPFAENPTFAIREGSTFRGIDIGALAGIDGLETNLRGEILTLEGAGFSLEELRGRARIDLTGSTINDATVTSGVLDLDTEGGVTNLTADLQFADGGRTDLDVQLDRTGRLSYRATGTVDSLDVGRLLGAPEQGGRLTLRLDVQGEGTDLRTATSRGRIELSRGRFREIDARRLLLDYRLNEGLLVVDTLALRSNVADATGGGTLALYDPARRYTTDFRLEANVDSLAPVRPYLGDRARALALGENRIDARLTGAPGGPLRLQSDVTFSELVYNDVRLSDFDGTVRTTTAVSRDSTGAGGLRAVLREAAGTDAFEALANAQVRGETSYFERGSFSTRSATFDAIYDGQQIDLEARLKIDPRRNVQLAGVLDPRPERRVLRLDTLNVRFGEDRWKLLQDATITYGEQYRVNNLLLYTDSGDQQIAADGVIDFDGRQNLVVTIEAFRIGAVADLLGSPQLDGTASGTLTLSGPASGPELSGTLDLDLASGDERTGDLQLALDYANQRLGVDATLTNEDQSTLTAEGYLPLDLRLTRPESGVLAADSLADPADTLAAAPADTVAIGEEGSPVDIVEVGLDTLSGREMAFSVQADSFSVAWARPLLDSEQVQELGGRLTADVRVGGTPAAPRLEGPATLTGSTLGLDALGTTYENIRARLRFTDDQVQIQEARLESGDGRLTARGAVALENLTLGQLDVAIDASQFRAIETDEYQAVASADLQLTGTTEAPILRGDVDVRNADVFLDAFRQGGGQYAEVDLGEEDLRDLREHFGVRITAADTTRSQVYQSLAMQLDVEIEGDTWLRSGSNPELDIQLEGNLDVEKAAEQDLQLFGSIEAVPERSRVVQFGKRFDIESGMVTFNGNPADPRLKLEAQYNVEAYRSRGNEVTITLSVRGRPDDLEFELGSNPSMATTDILSYIATGGGGSGAEGLATGVALDQIAGLVEGLAGDQGLGLDIITIEQDPQRGTVLTGGEYIYAGWLNNPLFVAVSQPLTSTGAGGGDVGNETAVTLEYEVIEGFLVRLLRRKAIRLNLRYEYAY
ncbi:MAG: hypothetical protein BRD44_02920 [Bacteroidetes bacterium QS_7_67_15]|nr:MAG: hypothetical protein BRD44_02920 [Bacteroidetes bacterium QS_7_67_15]